MALMAVRGLKSLVQHNLQFFTFRGHLLDVPFKLVVGILLGVGADSVLYSMYIIASGTKFYGWESQSAPTVLILINLFAME